MDLPQITPVIVAEMRGMKDFAIENTGSAVYSLLPKGRDARNLPSPIVGESYILFCNHLLTEIKASLGHDASSPFFSCPIMEFDLLDQIELDFANEDNWCLTDSNELYLKINSNQESSVLVAKNIKMIGGWISKDKVMRIIKEAILDYESCC
jgi:hypothetical protein